MTVNFVHDRTANGRMLKLADMFDERTRECLAIDAQLS